MYDALILAGGSARRLGGVDKPAVDVGGRTLLEHVVAAVADADRIVVVGPHRPLPFEVVWCVEDPLGGGPVAAIAVGLAHTSADVVLVLAADLPSVAPAVPVLLLGLSAEYDAALLVDAAGRSNHLAVAWRRDALTAALAALGEPADAAVRALTSSVAVAQVPDPQGWGRDCDTWADVDAARQALGDQQR
ncbi:molybdenum cofactor guanylyltransferase [uncultured Jatrophihabitans sp.]|uniref:molybdenum cofactor guanylyltransferase n=1 Tax=uncultured Jatrophihabitans sp. TaxID=1610747 RepID=UPI0035CB13C7